MSAFLDDLRARLDHLREQGLWKAERELASPQGARVAVRDGEVVGLLVAWPRPRSLLVERLAVHPDDVETLDALLAVAERDASERGLGVVRVDTDAEHAAPFVRRGYLETARVEQPGGAVLVLEKLLP